MKRLFLLLMICHSVLSLVGMSSASAEPIYTKLYLANGALTSKEVIAAGGYTCLYFGGDGKVKRMVRSYSYPESTLYLIAVYADDGRLEGLRFSIMEPEGFSVWGYCCRKLSSASKSSDSIYYSYEVQSMDDYSIKTAQAYSAEYESIPSLDISQLASSSDVLSYLGIKNVILPADAAKVKLVKPTAGSTTLVSSNNVNVRAGSSTDSRVARKVNVGTLVRIVRVLHEEDIPPFGKNYWYEVTLTNDSNEQALYIYGAFLELVDKMAS